MLEMAMAKKVSVQDEDQVYEMRVQICKAFANASRLKMLDMLATREYAVSELQAELGISAANVSQHLAILKSAGVVATRRDGKQILCSLAIPEVKQACSLIRDVLRAQIASTRKLTV
jgi:ArsR family transcriptional regulator